MNFAPPSSYYGQYPQNYLVQPTNPYMDRLNNLQQFQQSLQPIPSQQIQPNYLSGKVVDSVDVVRATDIPIDGSLYYFPKADGTEIYVKNWLPNGTTRILTFKPVSEQDPSISSNESEKINLGALGSVADTFMKRFDVLENRFDKLEQSILPKQATSRSKKEIEE